MDYATTEANNFLRFHLIKGWTGQPPTKAAADGTQKAALLNRFDDILGSDPELASFV
jgi:hypothetical protein